jgi:hypothetical protein
MAESNFNQKTFPGCDLLPAETQCMPLPLSGTTKVR